LPSGSRTPSRFGVTVATLKASVLFGRHVANKFQCARWTASSRKFDGAPSPAFQFKWTVKAFSRWASRDRFCHCKTPCPLHAHNRIVADGACLATWFLCPAASLKTGNSRVVSCTAGRIPMWTHTGPGFMTLNSDGLSARYKSQTGVMSAKSRAFFESRVDQNAI
jgi:hypothetical protein